MDSPRTSTGSRSGPLGGAAPMRVPMTVAAERGVSRLDDLAAERRVVPTRDCRPAAVIDSAEPMPPRAWSTTRAARSSSG